MNLPGACETLCKYVYIWAASLFPYIKNSKLLTIKSRVMNLRLLIFYQLTIPLKEVWFDFVNFFPGFLARLKVENVNDMV